MIEKSSPEVSQKHLDEKQSETQQTHVSQSDKKHDNWEADSLLSRSFAQPVRFVTYSGIKDLTKVRTKSYTLSGVDINRDRIILEKLNVLFVFPKEEMPALKPHIKIRKPLQAQNLKPIQNQSERFHVDDELLAEAMENASQVNIVTRAGYVLDGGIQHFDKYVLYMRIGGKVVIVYRHGLLELTVGEQAD